MTKNLIFWPYSWIPNQTKVFFIIGLPTLTLFSNFGLIVRFRPNFRFQTSVSIFDLIFDFWPNFRFLALFSMFRIIFFQSTLFWPLSLNFCRFGLIFDFWPEFHTIKLTRNWFRGYFVLSEDRIQPQILDLIERLRNLKKHSNSLNLKL